MLGFNVFVIFLLVLFIFVVAAGVKIVPQGYNYTVELASVIRSGVKLAPRTFVTAGALVTSDTEENAVYKGVPARKQQITADEISADAN